MRRARSLGLGLALLAARARPSWLSPGTACAAARVGGAARRPGGRHGHAARRPTAWRSTRRRQRHPPDRAGRGAVRAAVPAGVRRAGRLPAGRRRPGRRRLLRRVPGLLGLLARHGAGGWAGRGAAPARPRSATATSRAGPGARATSAPRTGAAAGLSIDDVCDSRRPVADAAPRPPTPAPSPSPGAHRGTRRRPQRRGRQPRPASARCRTATASTPASPAPTGSTHATRARRLRGRHPSAAAPAPLARRGPRGRRGATGLGRAPVGGLLALGGVALLGVGGWLTLRRREERAP